MSTNNNYVIFILHCCINIIHYIRCNINIVNQKYYNKFIALFFETTDHNLGTYTRLRLIMIIYNILNKCKCFKFEQWYLPEFILIENCPEANFGTYCN